MSASIRRNLADLALPPPASFWPPAIGVWVVATTAFAVLAVFSWRALMRYRADAYLRRAAAEIDALAVPGQGGASAPEAVSEILKRAAMVGYGRERVASLTGASWTDFLAASAPPGLTFEFSGGWAKAWLRHQRGRVMREA
jgi:hypothetical protein